LIGDVAAPPEGQSCVRALAVPLRVPILGQSAVTMKIGYHTLDFHESRFL
jgi:hypothetical protein